MDRQALSVLQTAASLADSEECDRLFLFLHSEKACRWFAGTGMHETRKFVLVVPPDLPVKSLESQCPAVTFLTSWAGNQSRFSRIKYAFLKGVLNGVIDQTGRIVCILGPWGKDHLDTITIHDLGLSWSEEFPFDPRSLISSQPFETVMAVVDVALDIGALGREGSPVGTTFVIGDTENVMMHSHQAVFNPFRGYARSERMVTKPEVVESIKELAKLDGAFVISEKGLLEAAGRHLDARSIMTRQLRGMGSRHRAAAGITRMTKAVAVVVSESTGRLTIFERGKIITTLEPTISRRLV